MLIGNNLGTFIKQEKVKRRVINNLAFYIVPRPGLEPGWIAPLVFETSASTYSAIWAYISIKALQRYIEKVGMANFIKRIFYSLFKDYN